jgi:hypothetical protein
MKFAAESSKFPPQIRAMTHPALRVSGLNLIARGSKA